jgi:hypothetical protein
MGTNTILDPSVRGRGGSDEIRLRFKLVDLD